MNLDQVYDELYGAIDENLRSDTTLAGRVGTLEIKMTVAEGDIADLEALIPEVPGRQLKLVNLGTEYTQELQEDIYTGTFEKAIVGGYLTINDHVYIMAHPDYWLGSGQTECTDHHMLIIPAGNLGTGAMNLSNIVTGGYIGSDMRAGHEDTTDPQNPVHVDGALQAVIDIIEADFGADNLLTHKDLLTSGVSAGGSANDWTWVDSTVDIMSETMVLGQNVWGSAPGYETAMDKSQLQIFVERPDLITTRSSWWLRSVVRSTGFAKIDQYGSTSPENASSVIGIRPVFAIKGTAPTP